MTLTNDDFKNLLDETIRPINERLDELGKELKEVKTGIARALTFIKEKNK